MSVNDGSTAYHRVTSTSLKKEQDQLQDLIERISLLDCGKVWDYCLTPVQAGDDIPFRENLVAHVLSLDHRVPSVGYLVCETRDKLKPEFFGLPGPEIARLRRQRCNSNKPSRIATYRLSRRHPHRSY